MLHSKQKRRLNWHIVFIVIIIIIYIYILKTQLFLEHLQCDKYNARQESIQMNTDRACFPSNYEANKAILFPDISIIREGGFWKSNFKDSILQVTS